MKRFVSLLAAATVFVASPALADGFDGPRVGVELGLVDDDFLGSADQSYGINAGYDVDLGSSVVGITGGYSRLFDDHNTDFREFSLGGRAGLKLSPRTLGYASAAYSNIDADGLPGTLDGVKFGLGLEHTYNNVYANVETRYGNYQYGVELYQTVVGLGVRF